MLARMQKRGPRQEITVAMALPYQVIDLKPSILLNNRLNDKILNKKSLVRLTC